MQGIDTVPLHGDLKVNMSIFNWFLRKKLTRPTTHPVSGNDGPILDFTPHGPTDRLQIKSDPSSDSQATHDKTERHERRELIYSVVRDAMIRAGILAASYKFKVLSLDTHGLQYLVMMDLDASSRIEDACQLKIEAQIIQLAKMRHNLTVTAVYWRVNLEMTPEVSVSHLTPGRPTHKGSERQSLHTRPATTRPARPIPEYEPLQEDEVAAFKRALAKVTPVAHHPVQGHIVTSGRRNPTPSTDFADTQRVAREDRNSPLSATQYGDLN